MNSVKVQDTKINMQKTVVFLYINNKAAEREIILAPKIIIYLGIKLTKQVKDMYSEKYKTLMKEI